MKKTIAAILLSTAFAGPALAADQGFYLGVNAGQSSTDTITLSTKTGTAYSIIGGYQFIKYLAAEVQWNDFGSPKLPDGSSPKIDGYSAKVVGIYPFNNQWSIFAKLGYAQVKMGGYVGTSKSDVTYGAGVQYNFDSHWGANLNYDAYSVTGPLPLSQKATTGVASIGMAYKF